MEKKRKYELLGESAVMRRQRATVETAAQSDAKVLIAGESGTKGLGDVLQPIWSYPIGQGAWDPVSAAVIRLEGLYEYAAAAGDMPEVLRIGEEMARLVDQV